MDYINRLDNYDGVELARIAQEDQYQLYDEALCIYKKFQEHVEAIKVLLHKQNFRRLVEKAGLVEHTGKFDTGTGGRPAELFRFRRDVLRERRTPGVGLPEIIRSL